MGGSGEQADHAGCVGLVDGLAEDLSVWCDDGGVGSEDKERTYEERAGVVFATRVLSKDGLGLFPGKADDVGDGRFTRQRLFRNVCRSDGEGVAGLREEFFAARRGGS